MRFILSTIILFWLLPSALRADTMHPQGLWSTYDGSNGRTIPAPKPKPKLKR